MDQEALIREAEFYAQKREANPLSFFVPNGSQEEYVIAIGESYDTGKRIFISTAGNGVGKSAVALNILGNLIFGVQTPWFNHPLFTSRWPYPKKIWYLSEHDAFQNKLSGEIRKWFPKDRYSFIKAGKKYESHLDSDTGWSIDLMTYDQDVTQFESADIGILLCLEANERVLLTDGRWVPIIDVNVGDKVVAYGSKAPREPKKITSARLPKQQTTNTVTAKIVRDDQELFEIKLVGGQSIKCTPEHRFFVSRRGWVQAKDIQPNDKLFSKSAIIKGEKTIEMWQAAVLGTLIGDGMMRGKTIHLTCFNDELLTHIKNLLPLNFYLREKERHQYYISSTTPRRNELKEWLVSVGIWGKLAYEKFIPDVIFTQPEEIRIEFLRYLYATDGWASNRTIGYASTSKRLCQDLTLLLLSLGIRSTLNFKKSQRPGKWRDQWYVNINRRVGILRFCSKISIPSKGTAQHKVYNKAIDVARHKSFATVTESAQINKTYQKVRVRSVSRVGSGTVVDIRTDPNHNFLVNGIVTHNCDEPPPRNIYTAAITRMRMGGICLLVMTPLAHSAWIFDDLIENPEQQKYIRVFYADVEANCITHGVRGRLSHEQIEFLASQYDEDEKEARLHGKPKHLSGKIYKLLHPSQHRHFIPSESFPQGLNTIYCAMDIHDRRPPAIVWMAANVNGKMYVVDEYPNDSRTPYHTIKSTTLTYKDVAQIIVDRERANGWDPQRVIRVMDPNYGRRNMQVLGKTIQEFFAETGLYFVTDVNDDLFAGHAAVKSRLNLQLDGKPGLLLGDNCCNTWFQMTRYGVKEHSTKKSESDGLSEKVEQKYKDFADCVRYALMIAETPQTKQEPKKESPKPREYDPPPAPFQVPGWRDPWASSRSSSTTVKR